MTSSNGKRDKVIQWRDVLEQNVRLVFTRLFKLFYCVKQVYVTVHGKTNVNDLAKRSLNSFVHRSLVVRNYLPFVNKFQ